MSALSCQHALRQAGEPDGYLAWHAWAESMADTHERVRCRTCGRHRWQQVAERYCVDSGRAVGLRNWSRCMAHQDIEDDLCVTALRDPRCEHRIGTYPGGQLCLDCRVPVHGP